MTTECFTSKEMCAMFLDFSHLLKNYIIETYIMATDNLLTTVSGSLPPNLHPITAASLSCSLW